MKTISKEQYIVEVVNSIAKRYKGLRQESKAPTFRPYLCWDIVNTGT